jgi:hypothetical protein
MTWPWFMIALWTTILWSPLVWSPVRHAGVWLTDPAIDRRADHLESSEMMTNWMANLPISWRTNDCPLTTALVVVEELSRDAGPETVRRRGGGRRGEEGDSQLVPCPFRDFFREHGIDSSVDRRI